MVPEFGESSGDRIRCLLVWGQPSAENLVSLSEADNENRPLIVLHFGTMSVKVRSALHDRLRGTNRRPMIVIDDAVLAWVAAQATGTLETTAIGPGLLSFSGPLLPDLSSICHRDSGRLPASLSSDPSSLRRIGLISRQSAVRQPRSADNCRKAAGGAVVGSASVMLWPVLPGIRTTGLRDAPGAPYPQADSRLAVLKPYRAVAADESNTNELVLTLTVDRSAMDTRADFERATPATVRGQDRTPGLAVMTDALEAQAPGRGDGLRSLSPMPCLWSGRMSVCRRATRLNSLNFLKHLLRLGHRRW